MADTSLHPADIFFGSLASGDFDRAYAVLTEDAVVWHNFDDKEQPAADNRVALGRFRQVLHAWSYCIRSRDDFDGGFLQQHVLGGIVGDQRIDIPICVVARLRDGKIARINEYFDPAALLPVRTALMKAAQG